MAKKWNKIKKLTKILTTFIWNNCNEFLKAKGIYDKCNEKNTYWYLQDSHKINCYLADSFLYPSPVWIVTTEKMPPNTNTDLNCSHGICRTRRRTHASFIALFSVQNENLILACDSTQYWQIPVTCSRPQVSRGVKKTHAKEPAKHISNVHFITS